MKDRDEILSMNDSELSALCSLEFFKGSGPGGQKRNKSSSAVRVVLTGTDIAAEDCTERSQHRNRANALEKLRRQVAYKIRKSVEENTSGVGIPFEVSCRNQFYALFVARVNDLLEVCEFNYKSVAERLGVSPTALLRKIASDDSWWTFFCENRKRLGLALLKP